MSPNVHFLYWIFAANILGIYVTRRVSVRPSGAGSGKVIFSVTRRSRSDESHLLTELLDVSIDFTNVTLVSDDT